MKETNIEKYSDYHGTDASNDISLFEYGLLVKHTTKDYPDEYHCIYKVLDDKFDAGHKRESELDDLINGKDWMRGKDIGSFLEYVGSNKEEWLDLEFVTKLSDLLNYYGWNNIMGESYHTFKIYE